MRYILRRLGFFAITLWAALTLNFFIPRFMPGNPVDALRVRTLNKLSPAALEQMLTSFGYKPHQNVFDQYFEYLKNMLTGQWGVSIGGSLGEPVSTIVMHALPWTVFLVGVTTVIAFVVGSLIGIVAGWWRGGKLDSVLPPVFVITSALPYFWVGLLLILVFSVWTNGFFPSDFNYDTSLQPGWTWEFVGSVLWHAVLPATTILIASIGAWILTMRNNMITVLAEDYVRMGRAKGLVRLAGDDHLRRAECVPAQPVRLCHVAGLRDLRRHPGRVRLQLSRARLPAVQLGAEHRLSGDAGAVHAVHRGRPGRVVALRLRHRLAGPARTDEGLIQMTALLVGGAGSETAQEEPRRRRGGLWRSMLHSRKAVVGLFILFVFTIFAVFPQWFTPVTDPNALQFPPALPPSWTHPLGTTSLGQDIWAQLVYGTRESLIIALVAGLFATVLSVLVGVTRRLPRRGHRRRVVDDHQHLPGHPDLPADHHPGHLCRQGHADRRTGRAGGDRLVVRSESACARRHSRYEIGISWNRHGCAASAARTSSSTKCCPP